MIFLQVSSTELQAHELLCINVLCPKVDSLETLKCDVPCTAPILLERPGHICQTQQIPKLLATSSFIFHITAINPAQLVL